VNHDIRTEIAAAKANIRLDLDVDGLSVDLIGKVFHQFFRAAALAVDVLAYETGLFHLKGFPFRVFIREKLPV
jgi:hypothetical protein